MPPRPCVCARPEAHLYGLTRLSSFILEKWNVGAKNSGPTSLKNAVHIMHLWLPEIEQRASPVLLQAVCMMIKDTDWRLASREIAVWPWASGLMSHGSVFSAVTEDTTHSTSRGCQETQSSCLCARPLSLYFIYRDHLLVHVPPPQHEWQVPFRRNAGCCEQRCPNPARLRESSQLLAWPPILLVRLLSCLQDTDSGWFCVIGRI